MESLPVKSYMADIALPISSTELKARATGRVHVNNIIFLRACLYCARLRPLHADLQFCFRSTASALVLRTHKRLYSVQIMITHL